MTPYPLIYCPLTEGNQHVKPACCPHTMVMQAKPGHGPDQGSGFVYGGALPDPVIQPWIQTAAGWWIYLDGHQPQHLHRILRHTRILRWVWIDGANEGHRWLVPQLLMRDENNDVLLTMDRELRPDGWKFDEKLSGLVESLMAIEAGVPLHVDQEARNKRMIEIAIELLSLGSWVDRDLLTALGWLTEVLAVRIVRVAIGLEPYLPGDVMPDGTVAA